MKLEINQLTKSYSKGKKALDSFTLTLEKGVYGILGPNGAGKSTLMQVLDGKRRPSGGMVRLGTGARPSIFAQQQNRLGQGRVIDVIWNKYPLDVSPIHPQNWLIPEYTLIKSTPSR